ncbi:MAG: ABC transporter permease [Erysipelotrichaceae bacterium]
MITLANLLSRLPSGILQGIIWGIMALGVFLTFKILHLSDLSVDGSFSSGAVVSVMLITANVDPLLSLLASFIFGLLIGTTTALLHTKAKIPAILAGILVQFGLYSINLKLTNGSANVSCNPDLFNLLVTARDINGSLKVLLVIAVVLTLLIYWFFGTNLGRAIRACGDNGQMSTAMGINNNTCKIIVLALSNGLVAFSGGLMSQYQGLCDINMGRGAIVIGLAAIIIGECIIKFILPKCSSFYLKLSSTIVGGVIYYIVMVIILWLRINSNDLKLFTAIIVAVFLALGNANKEMEGQ